MADTILAQLKIKQTPKEQKQINVEFKEPEARKDVIITTTIVDKRQTSNIDRTKILEKIQSKRETGTIKPPDTDTDKDKPPDTDTDKDKPPDTDTVKTKVKAPVKRIKKLKIIQEDKTDKTSIETGKRKTQKPDEKTISDNPLY